MIKRFRQISWLPECRVSRKRWPVPERQNFRQCWWTWRNRSLRACRDYSLAVRRTRKVVLGASGLLSLLELWKNLRSRRRLSRSVHRCRAHDDDVDDGSRFRSADRPAGFPSSAYQLALLELPRSRPENIAISILMKGIYSLKDI